METIDSLEGLAAGSVLVDVTVDSAAHEEARFDDLSFDQCSFRRCTGRRASSSRG